MEFVAIGAFVVGFMLGWLLKPRSDAAALKENLDKYQKENIRLVAENARLSALNGELPKYIELLSGRVLEDNGERQAKKLDDFMRPFKEQMEKIEKSATENKASFEQQIKNLMTTSGSLQKEASDLTRALRGDKKILGNFGELQLKRILEIAGLVEGRDYACQECVADDGGRFFTDFVIILPDDRRIVVDSKFTLNSYADFVNETDEAKKKDFLRQFLDATKKHIDSLSSKEYQNKVASSVGGNKLDFVVMFMPLEHAYMDLLQFEPKLYDYAFSRHVMLATPSLLLPLVRTINNLWKIEKQNKNVEKVIASLQGLYDKYAGFLGNFVDVKTRLDSAMKSYDNAEKQLSGRGGLSSRFNRMAELGGIQTTKELAIQGDDDE
ncbi:MAG: DNA recombination protein RmuC [Rickettsiales bacterium]|jgi:DNA recombination protein RmuC|nr:DNA recombination protein RmuC [Rickettsiales bacterium]